MLGRRQFIGRSALFGATGAVAFMPWRSVLCQAGAGGFVTAETAFGRVRGVTNTGVHIFKGIPYGADTAGRNRFMPPRNPAAWTGVRDALTYGPAAPQSRPGTPQQDGRESEDCLVLNVWTRGLNDGGRRPVMFWCHGGGYSTLSGSSPLYDGTNLCLRGDVVVVTINHRLNVLGFTHLGDIAGEEFAQSGNVGVLDIVHALAWVRSNIERFGGDPDRVMIFGESGGGRKVNCLLGMPDARGLFHRAVSQSGAAIRVRERDAASASAVELLSALGISRNAARRLQEVPLEALLGAVAGNLGLGGGPVLDARTLPKHPFHPVASDVNPDVPAIIGANRTEATYSAREADFNLDEAGMRARVADVVGTEQAGEVIDVYRAANPDAGPAEIHFLVASDASYVMASYTIAERRSALRAGATRHYYFRWETPVEGGRRMSPHSLDIPFAFDNLHAHRFTQDTGPDAAALADRMSDAWIAFARSGNPDTPKWPEWALHSAAERRSLVIDNTSQVVADPLRSRRELMTSILDL